MFDLREAKHVVCRHLIHVKDATKLNEINKEIMEALGYSNQIEFPNFSGVILRMEDEVIHETLGYIEWNNNNHSAVYELMSRCTNNAKNHQFYDFLDYNDFEDLVAKFQIQNYDYIIKIKEMFRGKHFIKAPGTCIKTGCLHCGDSVLIPLNYLNENTDNHVTCSNCKAEMSIYYESIKVPKIEIIKEGEPDCE